MKKEIWKAVWKEYEGARGMKFIISVAVVGICLFGGLLLLITFSPPSNEIEEAFAGLLGFMFLAVVGLSIIAALTLPLLVWAVASHREFKKEKAKQ